MADAKVVFLHGVSNKVVEAITSHTPHGFTTVAVQRTESDQKHMEAVQDADYIVFFSGKLTEEMLRSAKKVLLVQSLSAGYDSMNLRLLRELEIPCANNGGTNSSAVADCAVMMMLALYRKLVAADQAVRQGRWRAAITGTNTFEMADKVVGILGMGNIGTQVAKRVQAFDAKVQYHDKLPPTAAIDRVLDLKPVGRDELFQTSDIVTCHVPLTSETRHMVNQERLRMMKPTAMLINTSRGPVVDEHALIDALQEGRIAGAGLDVFEMEPVDPDNPLLKIPNVVFTPHSAGTTWDTWFRRAAFAYANVKRVSEGQAPLALAEDYDIE